MKKKIQHIKKNVFLQVIVKMNKVVCFGLDFGGMRLAESVGSGCGSCICNFSRMCGVHIF